MDYLRARLDGRERGILSTDVPLEDGDWGWSDGVGRRACAIVVIVRVLC